MHRSLNFGDDSLVARMTRFEKLDDARQTAGDVFGLSRGARNPGQTIWRIKDSTQIAAGESGKLSFQIRPQLNNSEHLLNANANRAGVRERRLTGR
jgi:hypothetical protein